MGLKLRVSWGREEEGRGKKERREGEKEEWRERRRGGE